MRAISTAPQVMTWPVAFDARTATAPAAIKKTIPTPMPIPWPRGPVVVSTPGDGCHVRTRESPRVFRGERDTDRLTELLRGLGGDPQAITHQLHIGIPFLTPGGFDRQFRCQEQCDDHQLCRTGSKTAQANKT